MHWFILSLLLLLFFFSFLSCLVFLSLMTAFYIAYYVKKMQLENRNADPAENNLAYFQKKRDSFYSLFKHFRFWTILCGAVAHASILLYFLGAILYEMF